MVNPSGAWPVTGSTGNGSQRAVGAVAEHAVQVLLAQHRAGAQALAVHPLDDRAALMSVARSMSRTDPRRGRRSRWPARRCGRAACRSSSSRGWGWSPSSACDVAPRVAPAAVTQAVQVRGQALVDLVGPAPVDDQDVASLRPWRCCRRAPAVPAAASGRGRERDAATGGEQRAPTGASSPGPTSYGAPPGRAGRRSRTQAAPALDAHRRDGRGRGRSRPGSRTSGS